MFINLNLRKLKESDVVDYNMINENIDKIENITGENIKYDSHTDESLQEFLIGYAHYVDGQFEKVFQSGVESNMILVDALNSKGVEASTDDNIRLNVEKVNDIKGGSGGDYNIGDMILASSLENNPVNFKDTIWTYTEHKGRVESMAIDMEDNLYTVAAQESALHKITKDGANVWKRVFPGRMPIKVAVSDEVSLVYTSHVGGIVNATSFSGGESWTYTTGWSGAGVINLDTDVYGNVFLQSSRGGLIKLSPTGDLIWKIDESTESTTALFVDLQENIYIGVGNGDIRKLNKNKNVVWEENFHNRKIGEIDIQDENMYIGTMDGFIIRGLHQSGASVWSKRVHNQAVASVFAGKDGYVYSTSFDRTVLKHDVIGNRTWRFVGHPNIVTSIIADNKGSFYTASQDTTVKKAKDFETIYKIIK